MSSRYGSRAVAHQQAVNFMLGTLSTDPNVAPALSNAFARMVSRKLGLIDIRVGFVHPHDDSLLDWSSSAALTRTQAALVLRAARRDGLSIERSRTGYTIAGASNPAWRC